MTGLARLKAFHEDESGVVSVDWVVLTAALVGLGMAVINVISAGMETMVEDIRAQLQTDHIQRSFHDPSQDTVVDTGDGWDYDSETDAGT